MSDSERRTPEACELEDRVVSALKARGLVRPARSWRSLAAGVAAGIVLFASGLLLGRALSAQPDAAGGPHYLLLLYETADFVSGSAQDEARRVAEYGAWARSIAGTGNLVAGEKLRDEARAITRNGMDTAGASDIGGYFVIRAADMTEASRIASSCPHIGYGGRVVVREIQR